MAYELIKVSELPELTTPSDPNVLPIQDGDYLKRISFENLKEAVTGDVAADLAAEVTARESAVSGEATARGNADTAILDDLASPYSASSTYAVGDYVIYEGQLYRCTTAIETAETWTVTHWTAVAMGDEVGDLRSALNTIDGYFIEGINLFNPNDPDYIANTELKTNGTTATKTGYFVSGYIPVRAGQTVCCHYPVGTYGSSSAFVFYDANKQRTDYHSATASERLTDANGRAYIRYTIPDNSTAAYFRLTGYMAYQYYYMYVYAATMPSTYSPYVPYTTISDDVKVKGSNIIDLAITKDQTNFVKVAPENLDDISKFVVGIIGTNNAQAAVDTSVTNWRTTDYIPVKPNTTYSMIVAPGVYYGAGFTGIPYFNKDKVYLGRIVPTGGISTTADLTTITTPNNDQVAYIRTSYPEAYASTPKLWNRTMIFEGEWPRKGYLAYDGSYRLLGAGLTREFSAPLNCLFGKTAIWNGDSICAADNDAQGGWAFRIGKANGMGVANYGIAGGCIAENVGSAHSVCGTLDTMITDFPNADYIIIEGGTNDADLLGTSGMGTFDVDDFTSAYITALDEDTFSGALESIFYRLVTQMKGKHIGYLIPQKMGHTPELVARRRTYFDRAIDICKKWGIPYLDLWNDYYFNWELSAHWDQTMTTAENEAAGNLYIDGQHLTTTGYAIESPVIAEWMKTI